MSRKSSTSSSKKEASLEKVVPPPYEESPSSQLSRNSSPVYLKIQIKFKCWRLTAIQLRTSLHFYGNRQELARVRDFFKPLNQIILK